MKNLEEIQKTWKKFPKNLWPPCNLLFQNLQLYPRGINSIEDTDYNFFVRLLFITQFYRRTDLPKIKAYSNRIEFYLNKLLFSEDPFYDKTK